MITKITEYSDFVVLKEDWNALLESSQERENVFLRHEWFDVWWQAFGKGKELLILLCQEAGKIIGIAPLMIFRDRYKGLPYKRLGFIEDPNAPSMNFIIKQGGEESVLPAILAYLVEPGTNAWHAAVLNKLPAGSSMLRTSTNCFSQQKIKYLLRNGQDSPYVPVNSDWETFLASTSVRFRKQLRNKINKLNKAGKVSFDVFDNIGVDGKHLEEAMSVSSRSWKQDQGTSMSSTPSRKRFFELLSSVASKNGWLRIWLLYLNGNPIATEYHLEYKGRTHAMRGDFDKSHDSLSPGSVLEAHIIEHCFKKGLLEYDFCGLPYGYKLRWTELLHTHNNILFYNGSYFSSGLYILQQYLPLIRWKIFESIKKASMSMFRNSLEIKKDS